MAKSSMKNRKRLNKNSYKLKKNRKRLNKNRRISKRGRKSFRKKLRGGYLTLNSNKYESFSTHETTAAQTSQATEPNKSTCASKKRSAANEFHDSFKTKKVLDSIPNKIFAFINGLDRRIYGTNNN